MAVAGVTSLSNHLLIAMPQLSDPNFSQTVSLICEHGESSSLAAASLAELGFTCVGDIVGGFEAWLAAGLPVTEAPPPGDGLPGMDSPA